LDHHVTGHEVILVRHGQTEWSLSGKHTGHTDIPLTDLGRRQADALGGMLGAAEFALVLSSPLIRAWAHTTTPIPGRFRRTLRKRRGAGGRPPTKARPVARC
jgi:broad specificity phosphatase PhoE